jgi:hypothetical protein
MQPLGPGLAEPEPAAPGAFGSAWCLCCEHCAGDHRQGARTWLPASRDGGAVTADIGRTLP